MYRTGLGYDLHKLVEGRTYVLGGVEIDFPLGFLGYSDGDVLAHAIIDAILGACAKRDIGYHFPESAPEFKGISSIILLEKTRNIMLQTGFEICNLDSVIIAETPKLSPYIPKIVSNISEVLKIDSDRINIKAKTNEGVGYIGEGKAVSSFCTVLLKKVNLE
jgi:2-C-methyl-D-erythritol 2,4-cyclodiphosphate synthase